MYDFFYLAGAFLIGAFSAYLVFLNFYRKEREGSSRILEKLDGLAKQSIDLNSVLRTELVNTLTKFSKYQVAQQREQLQLFSQTQSENFKTFSEKLADLMRLVERRLIELKRENTEHLEKIRDTVDEKLTSTLNKRLAEQFDIISKRLEQVHKGLGEMQTLASGVVDLKRILSGVKNRGTWGEVQLGTILSQFLSQEQYAEKVRVKPRSKEEVEFAVILPGKDDENTKVYLPIDSKFPLEDYQRLLTAYDEADKEAMELALKSLEKRIKAEAKRISEKYIAAPYTTDFAIMYLPTEGLYLEVIQRRGLVEYLQNTYRVVVAGPSTITAFLISLQMGFRTLAIQKRSSEVWKLLGIIRQEFSRFGGLLEKTSKKLKETQNVIDKALSKTRNITRKLERVESLPDNSKQELKLPLGSDIIEITSEE